MTTTVYLPPHSSLTLRMLILNGRLSLTGPRQPDEQPPEPTGPTVWYPHTLLMPTQRLIGA